MPILHKIKWLDPFPQIRKYEKDLLRAIRDEIRDDLPHVTGETRRSIRTRLTRRNVSGNISARVYDVGRRPGARRPPIERLYPWLRARGIPKQRAFAIARAIGERGLEPHHNVGPAVDRAAKRVIPPRFFR